MTREAERSRTSVVIHPAEADEAERTYVILGTRRGGTSMVAGVARALGLDLGDVGARRNNEDPRFQLRAVDEMRSAIAERNQATSVWGWKFPAAATYLPGLLNVLRNPYIVVVYRDPAAAVMSQERLDRPIARRTDAMALHEATMSATVNSSLVIAAGRPSLLVSHEKVTMHPRIFIGELADFLRFEPPDQETEDRIVDYMSPGKYKAFADYFPDDESATP